MSSAYLRVKGRACRDLSLESTETVDLLCFAQLEVLNQTNSVCAKAVYLSRSADFF